MKQIIQNTGNYLFATLSLCLFGVATLQAQTFPTPTGFTLPNGKSIVITYEVDVNANACPTGTIPGGDISNQSNVSGTNFAPVQTDDPDIAGSPGPTLTPFSALTLGNLVYKDVNRDGDYDSGTDLGVNGVLVRIYLDNGDGVLTVADGAALGSTTTANVSGQDGVYLFTACPGNYIVEIAASNFNPGGALYDNGLMAALISSPIGGATDPDDDVNNDDNGDPVAGFGVASAAITLAYGAEPINDGDADNNTNLSLDFGFKTPTTVTINDVTLTEGTGGAPTAFNFTVTRNDNSEAFSLTVNTNDGTAVSPGDFTAISGGTVNFTAGGSLTAMVTVLVNQDNIVEANENFTVVLSAAPAGVTLADASGLGTITNDDAAVVTLTSTTATLNEGNTPSPTTDFYFKATLNNPVQGGFTIAYANNDGTATLADGDYNNNDGTITFAGTAGENHDIVVQGLGDTKVELDETFTVSLGAITGGPAGVTSAGSPQTGTITNDDQATVTISNVSQNEGNAGGTNFNFVITLTGAVDAPVTMSAGTMDGTATVGNNDYNLTVGSLTFPANGPATQVESAAIVVNGDLAVEANETFILRLSALMAGGRNVVFSPAGPTLDGTGTIVNDDAATVTLTGGGAANEGDAGTTPRVFTATLNNPVQGGFTANYTTNDGTATTADNDYQDNDGTLTFTGTSGETKTITVLVNGDTKVEANETFTVALGAISGAPAGVTTAGSPQTGTITNDEIDWGDGPDSLPTISFYNGARHNTVLGFHLGAAIDGDPDGQLTGGTWGNLANGDDTDADGDDEDGVTLPSVFVTGTTATITVNASQAGKLDAWMDFNWNRTLGDAGEKIFNNVALVAGDNVLSFSVPAGAVVNSSFLRFRFSSAGGLSNFGPAADGEVEDYRTNIVSNQFSIDNPMVAEGNAGTTNLTFTVSRTTNNTASSVDYAITGGTATSGSDYAPLAAGTINFTAGGALTQAITVTVNGDLVVEDNETVIITLSNPVNGGLGANPGMGTITNDDNATLTLSGGIAQPETNAGTVNHVFTVTLSAAVQGGFTIPYTTNNGTATAGSDYVDNDGSLTFAGTLGETKTITVLANGDVTVELDETFSENLGAVGGTSAIQAAAITVSGSPQTGTIINDDAATVAIAGNVSQAENLTPQVFTVTLSNPVDVPVTVLFNTSNGTATTADNDYTGITNQTVTFAANTTTSQTVNVTIVNDNKVEADEVYNVAIGTLNASGRNVSLGTSSGTGTIVNDDSAVVTLSGGASQNEGNTGTTPYSFSATLNNPVQGGFSLAYSTNDGTATTGNNDYVDNDGPALVFAGTAGEVKTITVLVNGDFIVEADETFTVALGAVTGAPAGVTTAGSPQTATIVNDEIDFGDSPDTYATLLASNGPRHATVFGFRLGAGIDGENDGLPTANASGDGADDDGVTLPNPLVTNTTANVTVNASAAGKIDAWVDFNNNGNFTDAGEKVFNNVAVVGGNNTLSFAVPNGATPAVTFARFRLSTSGGLSFNGLAADGEVEDYQVQIVNTQFSINDVSVSEGNAGTTNLVFTVTRSNNASVCSVDYAITGGTATTADNDYQALAAGTLNFTAGGALTATITVVVNGDTKVELNETVDMTLSNPVNGTILDGAGTGTITNDDAAVITLSSPTITEGDGGTSTLTFTINMSNPSDANVDLNYTTLDGTATTANADYNTASGSHTFTPGQQSKTVGVTINGDCAIEANETFLLRLSALAANGRNISFSGGGGTLDGTGTISNDDALPVITCPGNLSVNAAPGVCNATVTLPLPTTSSLCGASVLEFHYRTVDAANNPTGAYTAFAPAASNTVNFAVGRYQIEWRVTDGSGASLCSYFLQVVDNQPPNAQCVALYTLQLNAGGTGTVTPANLNNGSTDNCGITTLTVNPSAFTCANVGPASSTLTLGDAAGNTAQCTSPVNVLASSACVPPAISNFGGPNIADPCTCLGNGWFSEEVVIGPANSGQQWRVQNTTLINPATGLPFAPNTLFTEIPLGGGQSRYVLAGRHFDGVGYSLTAVSLYWPGVVLSISNTCYYPDPVIAGPDGPFCLFSTDATFTGSAGGVGGTGQFYLDGAPVSTIETPVGSGNWLTTLDFSTLGVGSYVLVFEFDAGNPAGLLPPPNVGCIASVTKYINVIATPPTVSCNDLVQISLDANCTLEITPDMILEGTYGCYDDYKVEIDITLPLGNGPWIPAILDAGDIGKTYAVKVTHLVSGNSCWGLITVEDKLPPVMQCFDLHITCGWDEDMAPQDLLEGGPNSIMFGVYPDVVENCGTYTLTYSDESFDLGCGGSYQGWQDLSGYVIRTWVATDASGNQSTCTQIIYIHRLHVQDVHLPNDVTVSCTNPSTDPSVTGVPFVQEFDLTFNLFPNNTMCELQVAYADQILPVCDGTYKILRTWTVYDWCLPTEFGVNPLYWIQVIKVLDDQAPTVDCPQDMTVSTDPFNCYATPNLPDVLITDGCSRINSIVAKYTVGGITYTLNGSLTSFPGNNLWTPDTLGVMGYAQNLPLGTTEVTYIVTDDCGNSKECTFDVTVADLVPPVSACDEFTQVALGISGESWVNASTFDDGSYDVCSPVEFKVRRMNQNDCDDNSQFDDQVKFCCSDVGDTVTVIFRVYDVDVPAGEVSLTFQELHANDCMVQVFVEDKIKPACVPPAHVTTSCENFDPTLWNLYGWAQVSDNCCLDSTKVYQGQIGLTHTANYSQFDTLCNKGTIVRTFRAYDCYGNSSQCTQRIVVNYEQDYYVKFPNDVIVTECNGSGNYGEPTFFGEDCEMMGVSFQDEVFTVVPDACFKIERTWRIINWCTYNTNLPCINVPNPNPNSISNHPSNLPGPIVSALGTPAPWAPTVVKINPTDPVATNYSTFWQANANCYEYKQIIKIIDTEDPVFANCPATPQEICDWTTNDNLLWSDMAYFNTCTQGHDLCEAPADLCITVTDSCGGPEVDINYILFMDLNGDGVWETQINSNNPPAPNSVPFLGGTPFDNRPVPFNQKYRFNIDWTTTGNARTACVRWDNLAQPANLNDNVLQGVTPQLPYGNYKIKWIAQDGCGNESVCEYLFEVKDCKKPTVVCLNGLSVNIDDLLQPPPHIVTLWASDFLQYGEDNCTQPGQLVYGIQKSLGSTGAFPVDAQGNPIVSVTFDCTELGPQAVQLWAMDCEGNADYCETYVIVQDNAGNCGPGTNASVAGALTTETQEGLEDASVELHATHPTLPPTDAVQNTGNTGVFNFTDAVPLGSNVTVTPLKDDNPLNGVTTYDLVLISKHILGLDPLGSPYKMIAADANKSNSITTFDIVELRKLILGIYDELPNNTSWRFVDEDYNFPDPTNPWTGGQFPETKNIQDIQFDSYDNNFVGVKIGDVNASVIANSFMQSDDRSNGVLLFDIQERTVKAGEEFEVNFKAAEQVLGYQFTLALTNLEVLDIVPGAEMTQGNFGVFTDAITTSFDGKAAGEFTVKFRAKAAGNLSNMLNMSSRITHTEAYKNGNRLDVGLRFNKGNNFNNVTIVTQGFELYQNIPNPWENRTVIGFHLPEAGAATLSIFDETGRLLYSRKGEFAKGYNTFMVERSQVNTAGVLHYKVESDSGSGTLKMIEMK